MYYNTIIAWSLYFLVSSFRGQVPWATCDHLWNTNDCYSVTDDVRNRTNTSVSAASEFFE
jgi:SNF family Na+-dependent transporter